MGITRDQTTSYHPQHNWKVERMHRCLKNSLRARLLGRANWLAELRWVMLGLRAAANLDTGVSPSMLVTGQQPALPGQLVVSRANIDDASAFGKELASAMAAQTFRSWHRLWQHTRSEKTPGTERRNCAHGSHKISGRQNTCWFG